VISRIGTGFAVVVSQLAETHQARSLKSLFLLFISFSFVEGGEQKRAKLSCEYFSVSLFPFFWD
jgi:hypothetical protein